MTVEFPVTDSPDEMCPCGHSNIAHNYLYQSVVHWMYRVAYGVRCTVEGCECHYW